MKLPYNSLDSDKILVKLDDTSLNSDKNHVKFNVNSLHSDTRVSLGGLWVPLGVTWRSHGGHTGVT